MSCNQYVPPQEEGDRRGCRGGSVIVDPLGEVLAGPLWDEEGLLVVEVKDLVGRCWGGKMDLDVVGHYRGPWKVVPA